MSQFIKEKPLISVIVPVYNGQDYLKKCIDSIEKQTYKKLEIIIINDGSTDGTGKLCRALEEEYENIRVITTNDEGVSEARNAGLDQMKGEFFTFVDADDRLLPDTISALYDCIRETDSDIAGCGFFTWKEEDELGQVGHTSKLRRPRSYTSGEFLREGILKGNSRCWSKLYRSASVGEQRFRKGLSIGEDMLFLVDLLPKVRKTAEISYQGYGYFQNPTGAMNRTFRPQYMDQITCWEIAREKIRQFEMAKQDGMQEERDDLRSRVTAILMMAIMLTAGKLAMLSAGERRQQRQYIQLCHDKIKEEMQIPGAYEALSKGYRIKVRIFAAMPQLYLWMYHFRRYKR